MIAALAFLHGIAQENDTVDQLLEPLRRRAEQNEPVDVRAQWDWYYLQTFLQEHGEVHLIARRLSEHAGLEGKVVYLAALPSRSSGATRVVQPGQAQTDTTPPLPDDQIEHMMQCYREIKTLKPDWVPYMGGLPTVITELERAKRDEEATQLYEDAVAAVVKGTHHAESTMLEAMLGSDQRFQDLLHRMKLS